MSETLPEPVARFLRDHPGVAMVDAFFADLSGVVRGKRLPVSDLPKLMAGQAAFCASVFLLDTQGTSHDPLGHGFSDGDPDCFARAIPETLTTVPWAEAGLAQIMLSFERGPTEPLAFEPRHVLARTVGKLRELGLTPCVAFELEFYLIDTKRAPGGGPQPPTSPISGERDNSTQVYGMDQVDHFSTILKDITESCAAQGVLCGAISSEYAPGQFEINLKHVADPLLAADHCVMFKRAVKGVARRHGMQATFMAKPYAEEAGSGMHMHLSLLDEEGRNVFAGENGEPASERLKHAIGGVLKLMPDAMALLAPNVNSYRRFVPNYFVPTQRSWAFENRSVALRIPIGPDEARRIEHRVAGADANPYLVLASFLAGVHHGLVEGIDPGAPFEGNACTETDPGLPFRPRRALEVLKDSTVYAQYFGANYPALYAATKEAEYDAFEAEIPPHEFAWYLLAD